VPGPVGSVAPSCKFSYGKVVRLTRPRPRVALAPCSRGEFCITCDAIRSGSIPGEFCITRDAIRSGSIPMFRTPGQTGHAVLRAVHASERRHSATATPTLVAGSRWQASCWGTCNSEGAPESCVPSWAPIARLRRSAVTTAAASRRVSIGRRAPGGRAGSDAGVMRREREQDKGVRRLCSRPASLRANRRPTRSLRTPRPSCGPRAAHRARGAALRWRSFGQRDRPDP